MDLAHEGGLFGWLRGDNVGITGGSGIGEVAPSGDGRGGMTGVYCGGGILIEINLG